MGAGNPTVLFASSFRVDWEGWELLEAWGPGDRSRGNEPDGFVYSHKFDRDIKMHRRCYTATLCTSEQLASSMTSQDHIPKYPVILQPSHTKLQGKYVCSYPSISTALALASALHSFSFESIERNLLRIYMFGARSSKPASKHCRK